MRLAEMDREKAAEDNNGQQDQPITGNMAERAAAIIAEEKAAINNINNINNVNVDRRLPAHYGGGHYISNGYRTKDINKTSTATATYNSIDYKPINSADKDSFKIVSQDLTDGNCPIAKIPKVYVAARLWNEWISLADDYNTEWLAYLIGAYVKDDKGPRYEVRKMYFPPQVAHASHVEVDDDFSSYLPNTIGAIHSHVQMGVFFSGEDLAHSNWPVEIVVNGKGEYKVMIRHELECGRGMKSYSEILTVGDNSDSKYVNSLNRAFEMGKEMKAKRVAKVGRDIGYRTPEPAVNNEAAVNAGHQHQHHQHSIVYPSFRSDNDNDWHFRINSIPHRWDDVNNRYVKVAKVNGKWVDVEDDDNSNVTTDHNPDATGDSTEVNSQAEFNGSVGIDDETGRIVLSAASAASADSVNSDDGSGMIEAAAATQEELDRLMEGEVDAVSCIECGGTGKVYTKIGSMECSSCGGTGLKPGLYSGYGGYGDYSC